jgi:hypothetical protein
MFYRIRIGTGGHYINYDKVFTSQASAKTEIARERGRGKLLSPVALVECTRQSWQFYGWHLCETVLEIF